MKIKDKVLIVEDEQSISNFISMILTADIKIRRTVTQT